MDAITAQIMQMRALGYSQEKIANNLGTTQSAVSQRISTIRKKAEGSENFEETFWKLLIAAGGIYLFSKIIDELGDRG